MKQELELLAPAGTLDTLKAVIHAGADAVYFGGNLFGARAYAGNFNKEEVLEAIDFAHIHGKKLFMTINTLLKENEIEEQLYPYVLPYYEQGLDGVIVQDFGVLQFIKKHFKDLPIHTSTQMTVTNMEGAKFLAEQGASRVVMARELSLAEIKNIHEHVPVEIESFVHGALCYCYSGQCLFSSMLGGRSGNRGRCAQPCRLPYEVYGQNKKRINDNKHLYPLSPKDLCTIEQIPSLAENGIYSFKIEGRMKSMEYAAGVVSVYRKYMDQYLNYGASNYQVDKNDKQKLFDFGNRSGFTNGYYHQRNGADMITFQKPSHEKKHENLYSIQERKEKIDGFLVIKKDEPISLTVNTPLASVTIHGNTPFIADKKPITKDIVLSKIQKTGNTPFVFENLEILLDDGLFLPMAAINDLRRQALEALEKNITHAYRRERLEEYHSNTTKLQIQVSKDFRFTASVEQKEQLEPLLSRKEISALYLDSMVYKRNDLLHQLQQLYTQTKQKQKELYYILPAIFRKQTAEFYKEILPKMQVDGFLVKSYDALAFLLEQNISPKNIRLDHNMYTWSNQSRKAFQSLDVNKDTIPLELNRKELWKRDNTNSEMLIYGYMPLMTSAQCINGNISSCDRISKMHYLKDRYGMFFPVKNHCTECYNVLYNSKPLYLLSEIQELKKQGINEYRLAFTLETPQEITEILSLCMAYMDKKNSIHKDMENYTYGHYKRGVE